MDGGLGDFKSAVFQGSPLLGFVGARGRAGAEKRYTDLVMHRDAANVGYGKI